MRWYRRVNLHVAVSEASSLFGYFNQKGIADSHFYVRKDGTVEQMVDTAYQAYADLQGNDATISIETQGGLRNAQGEKWTSAQVESLAQIYAWAVKTHGIPLKVAKDSIPTGTSSHGLSWHRLGIDGNFPSGLLSGRKAGGMHYSKSAGKVCPGNAKIRQVDDVYSRARAILGGAAPNPGGSPAPAPQPTPERTWLDMATKDDVKDALWELLTDPRISIGGDTAKRYGKDKASLYSMIRDGSYALDGIRGLFDQRIPIFGALKGYTNADDMTIAGVLRYAATAMPDGRNQQARLLAEFAATQAAVRELAKVAGGDIDVDQVIAAITTAAEKAATEALSDLKITLTTED